MREYREAEAADAARALLRALLDETGRLLRLSGCPSCPPDHQLHAGADSGGRLFPMAWCPAVNIALSGGGTALQLFDVWVREFAGCTPWEHLHFFWADERCVPPVHPESNYGEAATHWLARVPVPPGNVHRIRGEAEPAVEAARYAALVTRRLPLRHGVPLFHFVLLGIGADGHTASVFPGADGPFWKFAAPYAVSIHPHTGQRRITVTGRPMLQALHTWFLATGAGKQTILNRVRESDAACTLPAARVLHGARDARLFVAER